MHHEAFRLPDDDRYEAVAVASSAGGMRALRQLLGGLNAAIGAPLVLAHHRGEHGTGMFLEILNRTTTLTVKDAREGEAAQAGCVYVAPGGRHLELDRRGRFTMQRCGRVGFVCPSADLLFESVAARHGSRALAVVLTGQGRDGARGVVAIRRAGGFVLVQDPTSAEYPGMPASAIETRKADLVLPLEKLAYAIRTLVAAGRKAA